MDIGKALCWKLEAFETNPYTLMLRILWIKRRTNALLLKQLGLEQKIKCSYNHFQTLLKYTIFRGLGFYIFRIPLSSGAVYYCNITVRINGIGCIFKSKEAIWKLARKQNSKSKEEFLGEWRLSVMRSSGKSDT